MHYTQSLTVFSFFVVVYGLCRLVSTYWRLRNIPGPFWAKITNFQRMKWVKTGQAHEIHQRLHEKYGPVVRLGPNMVSVSDPSMIPGIYSNRVGFPKSDFYRAQMPYTPRGGAMPAVFSTQDENIHKQLRSPIASLYSMTNVLRDEPAVDKTLDALFQQLDQRFVGRDKTFDLGSWLQYFAFDVMGTLTFSKRYSFLEEGKDVHGVLNAIWKFMKTAAPMGQVPWLDYLLHRNAAAAMFLPTTGSFIMRLVSQFIEERKAFAKAKHNEGEHGSDMLSRFLAVQEADPKIPHWAPKAWTFSNINAGSDSTANVMRTIFYHLLTKHHSMNRLMEELSGAEQQGSLSRPIPNWKQIRDLPYLDACVLEALRIHPPFALPFERVVPDEGVKLGATYLPGGTVVGMSPYVVNRHRETFGDDPDQWQPERWLELNLDQRRKREHSLLTFGAGRRVCLGKNIAILEIKKLVSALVLRYQFRIIEPHKYRVENRWFFRQLGLKAIIDQRPASHGYLADPQPPPALNIPQSSSTVAVRVIDPEISLHLEPSLFWQPPVKGLDGVNAPIYCFLISNNNRHVIFDLGVRKDWENLAPSAVSLIKRTTVVETKKNISEILDSDETGLDIRSKDIEAVIWSHHHFDHTGDPSTFPPSTDLVVGPGVHAACWPGYPTNPDSMVLDSDIKDRNVREISFAAESPNTVRVGSFEAFDYFNDGSFYLLNAPGHCIGHMCAIARVTTAPDSFVFMGADACHHPGVLRPSKYLPLPSQLPRFPSDCSTFGGCPGEILQRVHPSQSASEPFFTLSPTLFPDYDWSLETVEKIKELDALEEVFVILAHDETLHGQIDFFPRSVNGWRDNGCRTRTRWLFCEQLKGAL